MSVPMMRAPLMHGLGIQRDTAYYDGIMHDLGMQVQLATAKVYPDLANLLMSIYTDRVAKLPWVPADWLGKVKSLMGSDDGLLLYPIKATRLLGFGVNTDLPQWAQDNAKAWDEFADRCKTAVQQFMDGKLAEGRQQLQALYADAAFWDWAYTTVKTIETVTNTAREILNPSKNLVIIAVAVAALGALWLFKRK